MRKTSDDFKMVLLIFIKLKNLNLDIEFNYLILQAFFEASDG